MVVSVQNKVDNKKRCPQVTTPKYNLLIHDIYLPVLGFRYSSCICLGKVALTVHCRDCSTKLAHGMQSFREVI